MADCKGIKYQRDLRNTYLIITCGDREITEEYDGRMVLKNRIKGFAVCEVRSMNGEYEIWYDISSRQTLEQIYEIKQLSFFDLKLIFSQISLALQQTERYLLDDRKIRWEPGCIYWNLEKNQGIFIYDFCTYQEENRNMFAKLAEFFLERVDHGDEKAVELVYTFYEKHKNVNFSIQEIWELLEEDGIEKTEEINTQFMEIDNSADIRHRSLGCKEDGKEEHGNNNQILKGKGEKQESICEQKPEDHPLTADDTNEDRGRDIWKCLICFLFALISAPVFKILELYFCFTQREILLWAAFIGLILLSGFLFLGQGLYKRNREYKKKNEKNKKERKDEKEHKTAETDGNTDCWESVQEEVLIQADVNLEEQKTVYLGKEIKIRERKLVRRRRGKEEEINLKPFPFLVGKAQDRVSLSLKESSVSRIHAKFIEEEGNIYLEDLHSTNGTYVNDMLLAPHERLKLKSGDSICFGRAEFIYY